MTRRERLHQETQAEIKSIARQQMAAEGNESLSLRAVARQMEITAPALYRYFASRDDLITALIVDAFNGLADAMLIADTEQIEQRGQSAYGARLQAVMLAYRAWALAHPTDFGLIYGTPIPGYHAPSEITAAASARGITVPVKVIVEAHQASVLKVPSEYEHLPPTVKTFIQQLIEQQHYTADWLPFYIGIMSWTRIHGMVMLELFDHTPPTVGDTEAFYRFEIATLLANLGLTPEQSTQFLNPSWRSHSKSR